MEGSFLSRWHLIQSSATLDHKLGNNLVDFYCLFCLNVNQTKHTVKNQLCNHDSSLHALEELPHISSWPIHAKEEQVSMSNLKFMKIRKINIIMQFNQYLFCIFVVYFAIIISFFY